MALHLLSGCHVLVCIYFKPSMARKRNSALEYPPINMMEGMSQCTYKYMCTHPQTIPCAHTHTNTRMHTTEHTQTHTSLHTHTSIHNAASHTLTSMWLARSPQAEWWFLCPAVEIPASPSRSEQCDLKKLPTTMRDLFELCARARRVSTSMCPRKVLLTESNHLTKCMRWDGSSCYLVDPANTCHSSKPPRRMEWGVGSDQLGNDTNFSKLLL